MMDLIFEYLIVFILLFATNIAYRGRFNSFHSIHFRISESIGLNIGYTLCQFWKELQY